MKKLFAFICFASWLSACSPNEEMPKNVLPISNMKAIVWDMSLADNMAAEKYALNRDSQRIMVTGLYNKIFSLHKIDKSTFYRSMDYYETHPTVMQVLYDSVSAYGAREKTKAFQKAM